MDHNDYLKILESSARRVRAVSTDFIRPIAKTIDWDDRLIAIKGARGTGKTTMILQHIKQAFGSDEKALYISLDNLWFETHPIQDAAEMHVTNGGTHLFIDEVHYCKNWQTLLKNLYDEYPKLKIVYSGSSILKLDSSRGDLSRRQIEYHVPGLSFREFLEFEGILTSPAVTLEDLLHRHADFAAELTADCSIIPLFNRYLREGYYPFYKEVYAGYGQRLSEITNQVLESDYPAVENISFSTVRKIKKMLYILAQSCPQTPNMVRLYEQLETDRNQGLQGKRLVGQYLHVFALYGNLFSQRGQGFDVDFVRNRTSVYLWHKLQRSHASFANERQLFQRCHASFRQVVLFAPLVKELVAPGIGKRVGDERR